MVEKKVLFLLGQGFEDSEFRIPYDRLKEAEIKIDVVGPQAGALLEGYRRRERVKADKGIDDVHPEEYDALVIPGGHSPDHLRADERFVRFVEEFDRTGKPLASVCHGPQLLISAGLVRGRRLTAWKTVQDDLRKIGAEVPDEPLVVDRNWITSRQPGDLEVFSAAIVRALEGGIETAAGRETQPFGHVQPGPAAAPHARKGEMPVAEAAEEELPGQRPSRSIDEQSGLSASDEER
jgi:protease I